MLIDCRKYETSSAQAEGIEEQFKTKANVNAKTKINPSKQKCYYCRCKYPHENWPCPTKSSTCNYCGIQGHFAKFCPSREKSNFGSEGKQERSQKKGLASPDNRCWENGTRKIRENNKSRMSKCRRLHQEQIPQMTIVFTPYHRLREKGIKLIQL